MLKVGDRVMYVGMSSHIEDGVGEVIEVKGADGVEALVRFDDGYRWWCWSDNLELVADGPQYMPVEGIQGKTVTNHDGHARFHELLKEIGDLHDKKQQDYGADGDCFANVRASKDFGVPAWVGAMVRLNDKVKRLQAFAQKGQLANESAKDSMMDIAVYALIAYILYEQEGGDA